MRTPYPQDPATASQIRFSITTTQGEAEALDRIADDWTQTDKDRGLVRKPWTRNTVIGQMIKKCLRIRKVR